MPDQNKSLNEMSLFAPGRKIRRLRFLFEGVFFDNYMSANDNLDTAGQTENMPGQNRT